MDTTRRCVVILNLFLSRDTGGPWPGYHDEVPIVHGEISIIAYVPRNIHGFSFEIGSKFRSRGSSDTRAEERPVCVHPAIMRGGVRPRRGSRCDRPEARVRLQSMRSRCRGETTPSTLRPVASLLQPPQLVLMSFFRQVRSGFPFLSLRFFYVAVLRWLGVQVAHLVFP